MPMAGNGSRFSDQGYYTPKPFIPVNGIPMFSHAEKCIGIDFDEKIFIVRKEHDLKSQIMEWYPDSHVIELDQLTDGTACTIMAARDHFEDGSSIFVSNCDQHIDWDPDNFKMIASENEVDGIILNFHCPERDPKWSYAEVNSLNNIVRVAEKNPISDWATAGLYYWRDGRHFIQSVEDMIAANDRVNNEFYTCPVYNYTVKLPGIQDIRHMKIDRMQGIGTPPDLMEFLGFDSIKQLDEYMIKNEAMNPAP